jgi:NitT/TauT family transport system ATP-binding protein
VPQLELGPPTLTAKTPYQALPHARRGAIAGLLELLNDHGKQDLYRVAEELRMDVGDLLPIVEAATLVGFAVLDHGDVEVTPAGKAFAEADIPARKALFREAALARVELLKQISTALASKSDHSMPLEFFRDILREHFDEAEAGRQIETALNWGRYGNIITYDSASDKVWLFDPASAANRDEAVG